MIKLTRTEKATFKDRQTIKDLKKEVRELKRSLSQSDEMRLHYYNQWVKVLSDHQRLRTSLRELIQ
jgi:hypothetical protein